MSICGIACRGAEACRSIVKQHQAFTGRVAYGVPLLGTMRFQFEYRLDGDNKELYLQAVWWSHTACFQEPTKSGLRNLKRVSDAASYFGKVIEAVSDSEI